MDSLAAHFFRRDLRYTVWIPWERIFFPSPLRNIRVHSPCLCPLSVLGTVVWAFQRAVDVLTYSFFFVFVPFAMAPKQKLLNFQEKGVILDKLNRGVRVIAVLCMVLMNVYGVHHTQGFFFLNGRSPQPFVGWGEALFHVANAYGVNESTIHKAFFFF